MKPIYYQIEYQKIGVGNIHSDGCMEEIDRNFLHQLLDEWIDNVESKRGREEQDPNRSSLLLKLCEVH